MKSNASNVRNFSTKPLAVAVAMALFAPVVLADNGMPGQGLVVRNFGAGINVNGIPLPGGNQIVGLNNNASINSTSGNNTVIQWGSPGVVDGANKAGFNIAAGKTLNFTSTGYAGFLNIDISGAMSNIAGKIVADGNSIIAISNEKGITIASGATIVAPVGFAVVGANLNTIDAIDAFALPGACCSPLSDTIQMNFKPGAPVTVAGNLSAVGSYLLVAGSDSVNVSGKAPAGATVPVYVLGGVGSDFWYGGGGTLTLNDTGAASTTVRSSAPANVTINYGTTATPFDASAAGHNLIAYANGDLTNAGVLEFAADGPFIRNHLQWTGTLYNTGTLQTTTVGTYLSNEQYTCPSICLTVDWYNNKATQPYSGGVNNSGLVWSKDGGVTLVAFSGDATNSGTILAGGVNGDLELESFSGNVLLTATSVIHAVDEVGIKAGESPQAVPTMPRSVINLGSITSDTDDVTLRSEYGSVTNGVTGKITAAGSITLQGNAEGSAINADVINLGTLTLTNVNGGSISLENGGKGGTITLGGTVNTSGGGKISFVEAVFDDFDGTGVVNVNTALNVFRDKNSTAVQLTGATINVTAPITVTEFNTGAGAGTVYFFGNNGFGSNATTISANLTAGAFYFDTTAGGGLSGQPFDMAVALNGNLTTTAGGYRTVELYEVSSVAGPGVITANHVVIDASGNVRNPVPVSTNYLVHGLNIATVGINPIVEFTARSPAKQVINLAITGDATVSSGSTVTLNNPCYTGLCILPSGGYIPQSNSGSSLLITATGNLSIGANNGPGTFIGGGQGGLSFTNGFLFPGGVAFVAGGALNVNTVVDNAFTGTAVPFQGVYFQGTTINALQPIYTNGNSFVNYSVRPNGGVGLSTTYQARAGSNFLGFPNLTAVINPLDSFLNTYTILANAVANGQPWLPLVSFTPITQ